MTRTNKKNLTIFLVVFLATASLFFGVEKSQAGFCDSFPKACCLAGLGSDAALCCSLGVKSYCLPLEGCGCNAYSLRGCTSYLMMCDPNVGEKCCMMSTVPGNPPDAFDCRTGGCPTPQPSLTATLTADPSSGQAPLTAKLTTDVGGTATGTATFSNRSCGSCTAPDCVISSESGGSFVCTYANAGTYTASVVVNKGGLYQVATEDITVTDPDTCSPDITCLNHPIVSWSGCDAACESSGVNIGSCDSGCDGGIGYKIVGCSNNNPCPISPDRNWREVAP